MAERRKRARKRALRAAQVVTIALALGAGGCSDRDDPIDPSMDSAVGGDTSTRPDTSTAADAAEDSSVADAVADATADAALDATADAASDAAADAAPDAIADAGLDSASCIPPHTTKACCDADPLAFWDETTMTCIMAVPGPFVPPAMA